MSFLADILANKRREVDILCRRARTGAVRTPIDVVAALRRRPGEPLRLIAEVKLRSPSAGELSRALPPGERVLAYAEAGAAMVSVLCDEQFFDGSWEHMAAARALLDQAGRAVPLLAKEFVIDERQIAESRDRGADAVLLIARIVDPPKLLQLARAARSEGVEPLIEVTDEREVQMALAAEARIVGVNARDLDTLTMDGERAARVCSAIPADLVAVYLSGLRTAADVARLAPGRVDAALIGEALMRDDDPRARLRVMVDAARGE
ncbi:MAG: indole-3-glycerol-phosphate synthase [Myxococcota bacterium]|nr:indole-3-glycerol-phosphate synthase [Myxococcota bacterium]